MFELDVLVKYKFLSVGKGWIALVTVFIALYLALSSLYCLPRTWGGQAGKFRPWREQYNSTKTYSPPPSQMSAVSFHYFGSVCNVIWIRAPLYDFTTNCSFFRLNNYLFKEYIALHCNNLLNQFKKNWSLFALKIQL